jgi:diacylglycerol kinase (ATP)
MNIMIQRLLNKLKNSLAGLRCGWHEDTSFRIAAWQTMMGIAIASILTFVFEKNFLFWLLLVGSLFPVLIVEMINCSIEAVTDKASPERHPLAKKAKDMGSAAVFLTRLMAVMAWAAVLLQI